MSTCASITILKQFSFIPNHLTDSSGFVNLDLPAKFSFQENKVLGELNDLGKLTFNYITGIQIENSEKNKILARNILHPNNEFRCEPLAALISSGCATNTDNEILFKKYSNDRIEVDVVTKVNDWAKKLALCSLSELYKDEEFVFTCDNVLANIQSQNTYQVGNPGFTFPEAFYGNSHSSQGLGYDITQTDGTEEGCGTSDGSIEFSQNPITYNSKNVCKALTQQRPWLFAANVFERAFCKVGKPFSSPLLESEFGSRIMTLNLNKEYGTGDEKYLLNMAAEHNTSVGPTTVLWNEKNGLAGCHYLPNTILDNGGGFNGRNYCGVGTVKVKGSFKFRFDDDRENNSFVHVTFIKRTKGGGGTTGSIYKQVLINEWKKDQEFCIEIDEEISISEKQELCLHYWRSNSDIEIFQLQGSSLQIEGCRKLWEDGDVVKMSDLISSEVTALDYVKGITEALNLKWFEDPKTCKIIALQPYEITKLDETVPGFFDELELIDWTEKANEKNICVTAPEINSPRYCLLKYKEATDLFLKDNENFPVDLWSRTIDLGEKFTSDETKERENPLFEPVINETGGGLNSMLLQSKDGEDSWCLGNKIAFSYGLRDSFHVDTSAFTTGDPNFPFGDSWEKTSFLNCKHEEQTTTLIAGQYIPGYLSPEGGGTTSEILQGAEIDCNGILTYEINAHGNPPNIQTAYHLFWARYLLESLLQIPLEYIVPLSCKEYGEINFRNRYLVTVEGKAVFARLTRVFDFQACRNIPTPVEFIAMKPLVELCGIITPDGGSDNNEPICLNFPSFDCQKIGENWFVSIGGSMEANIDSVLWECRTPGGTWETLGETGSSIMITPADFGSEPCKEVKATVSFLPVNGVECLPITLPNKKLLNCVEVIPVLDCVVTTQGTQICASAVVDAQGEAYTANLYVDLNDGNGNQPYNESTLICGLTAAPTFGGTVDFTEDNCDPVDLIELTCEIPDLVCPVGPLTAHFICDGDCWTAERGEYQGTDINFLGYQVIDRFLFRCWDDEANDWGEWCFYKEKVCCNKVEFMRTVEFCDADCPKMKSEIYTCDKNNVDPGQNTVIVL